MRPQQAPVSGKVFIQRDYSSGTRCQFQTKFPAELENRTYRGREGCGRHPGR
ncbi:Golgin sub A member 7 [Saguinus oedipus]|uniref:Golgin sub A member 7 n=1 Tax=Saguinus oedipus TaxID=9490 RepID=A0ABQ9U966_SAGOE|nr:Golgin sub A member 7 [Saguinus oedipus]